MYMLQHSNRFFFRKTDSKCVYVFKYFRCVPKKVEKRHSRGQAEKVPGAI